MSALRVIGSLALVNNHAVTVPRIGTRTRIAPSCGHGTTSSYNRAIVNGIV
ncbi:hypothetical protein [Arthrobacter sp. HLT1-21]